MPSAPVEPSPEAAATAVFKWYASAFCALIVTVVGMPSGADGDAIGDVGVEFGGASVGVAKRRGASGLNETHRGMGGEKRREVKSSRNGEHRANDVVRGRV
eukprot:14681-Pelagococcus_subviridis.AAC.3